MHIDPARSRAVVRAAPGRVRRSSAPSGCPPTRSTGGCGRLPGIGVWTCAEVRFRAHGDADAVSFGDYHVAKNVGWALTGEEVDDDGLAELLEPYRPHRYRVQRLVELAGCPARGAARGWRRARHLPGVPTVSADLHGRTARAAWRWVLDQVRRDDGRGSRRGDDPPTAEPPSDRDGMHSGIGGLAHVLAEIRLVRPWTAEEQRAGRRRSRTGSARRVPPRPTPPTSTGWSARSAC